MEDLPPVLLDSAEVTKKLGEKYIWIDRLCIQQDNLLDRQENASIMARVFEQAVLTIGAVSSASVHESSLRPSNEKHRDGRSSVAVQWPDACRNRFRDIRVRARSKALDISYTDGMKAHHEPLQYVCPLRYQRMDVSGTLSISTKLSIPTASNRLGMLYRAVLRKVPV